MYEFHQICFAFFLVNVQLYFTFLIIRLQFYFLKTWLNPGKTLTVFLCCIEQIDTWMWHILLTGSWSYSERVGSRCISVTSLKLERSLFSNIVLVFFLSSLKNVLLYGNKEDLWGPEKFSETSSSRRTSVEDETILNFSIIVVLRLRITQPGWRQVLTNGATLVPIRAHEAG